MTQPVGTDADPLADVPRPSAAGEVFWVGDAPPLLPGFDALDEISGCAASVKAEINGYLESLLGFLVGLARVPADPEVRDGIGVALTPPAVRDERVWRAALYGHHCDGIVWATAEEARGFEDIAAGRGDELDELGCYLDGSGLGDWVWSVLAGMWRVSGARSHRLVDPRSLYGRCEALGGCRIALNRYEPNPWRLVGRGEGDLGPCLEDLARYVTAQLHPGLYRSYRHDQDGFGHLPAELADLVGGHFRAMGWRRLFCHDVLLEILLPLFEDLETDHQIGGGPSADDDALVAGLGEQIAGFLCGERALPYREIPELAEISVHQPARIVDVAVLVQHLAYVHPATEIEASLYTRVTWAGGVNTPEPVGEPAGTVARLAAIASLDRPTWQQRAWVLCHRALRDAYRRVAHRMLSNRLASPDRQLAHAVIEHLDYQDHHRGGRRNLYAEAAAAWQRGSDR